MSNRKLKIFNGTKNLYCVVTKCYHIKHILFAWEHLTKKGYICFIRKINGSFYVIRQFLPAELKDSNFLQTYGEIVEKNGEDYTFTTQKIKGVRQCIKTPHKQ